MKKQTGKKVNTSALRRLAATHIQKLTERVVEERRWHREAVADVAVTKDVAAEWRRLLAVAKMPDVKEVIREQLAEIREGWLGQTEADGRDLRRAEAALAKAKKDLR